MHMTTAIAVEDLKKTFYVGFFRRKAEVLRGVTFEVKEGKIFGFLGPNGAGKTTTIKTLLGLIFPTSGRVTVLGHPVTDVAFRRQLGFLPDNPYFYSYLSGEEFLQFCGHLFGLTQLQRDKKVD